MDCRARFDPQEACARQAQADPESFRNRTGARPGGAFPSLNPDQPLIIAAPQSMTTRLAVAEGHMPEFGQTKLLSNPNHHLNGS